MSGYKFSKEHRTVISELNLGHKNIVAENLKYVKYLLKTLLFCTKQGIVFRGYNELETWMNFGNFLELFKLKSFNNKIIIKFYV